MQAHAQEIWRQIHTGLRAFIVKRVADEAEVDDIVQNVWLKMQRGLGGLNDQRRLISWIYQIARRAIIDHYRDPRRRREIPTGLASEIDSTLPTPVLQAK